MLSENPKILWEEMWLLINGMIFEVSSFFFFTDFRFYCRISGSGTTEKLEFSTRKPNGPKENVSCILSTERKLTEKQPSTGIETHGVEDNE